jgi:hypothetical protein
MWMGPLELKQGTTGWGDPHLGLHSEGWWGSPILCIHKRVGRKCDIMHREHKILIRKDYSGEFLREEFLHFALPV